MAEQTSTETPATGDTTSTDGTTAGGTTTTTTDTVDHEANARKWQELSRKNEADLRKAQAELDKVKKANESEGEKAVREAEERGKQAALTQVTGRLISSEIRVAASTKLADPADAEALLGDVSRFADKDGNVDGAAIGKAIEDLVKAKPYLARTKTGALPGGGKTPGSGFSINDDIRARAGRS